MAVTFLSRVAPTLAPTMALHLHWTVAEIGYLSSLMALGSAIFSFAGLPLVLRAGPIRSLQVGLVVGAVGALLYVLPLSWCAVIGSLMIGLAAGPQAAAGSDVLRRHAPAGSQNLIFSIKQSGVPLAGVLAGLLLPTMALVAGLTLTFVLCATLTLAALWAMQPIERRLDADRDRKQPIHPAAILSLSNLRRPVRALARDPDLRRIAVVGGLFALGQGAWFTFLISYLVLYLNMSLAIAGVMFALMQAVSALSRPAAGWLADRLSALTILKAMCITSTLTTVLLATLTPAWPQWALVSLVVVAGATVASWNGVQIAQVAHLARPGTLGESLNGATLLVLLASGAGPALFGLTVALGGNFRIAFGLAALCTLAAWIPLSQLRNGDPTHAVPAGPGP
ncbi:MAG: MFS transporter [Burkholderiaceae bacterium]